MPPQDAVAELDPRLVAAIRERAGDAAADHPLFREFLAKAAAAAAEQKAAELKRIEGPFKLLVSGLRTPPPGGCSREEYHKLLRAWADTVMKDLGPDDRLTLLHELPEREREILRRAYPPIFRGVAQEGHLEAAAKAYRQGAKHLEAAAKIAKAGAKAAGKKPEQFSGLAAFIDEARAMAAAKRRAARALREKKDPSVEMRESRRTTRKALNRARGSFGLHPLPVPRPLRRSACQGARHRRAPGRKPMRRPRSRSTTAPTRGDPDPDGDPEPPAPAPGAERRHTGGTCDHLDAALAAPERRRR